MGFVFTNSGDENIDFGSNTPGGMANPSTIVFHAPDHSTFPAQSDVWVKYTSSLPYGTPPSSSNMHGTNCVVTDAGKTLSCTVVGGANAVTIPGAYRSFWPQVTVDSTAVVGTVLTGGSADLNLYNYAGANTGYMPVTINQALLTRTPGPGQPIYNEDGSVDLPGTGAPGGTVTVKDASGATIGTATVAADGTYVVKLPAAQAGIVTVTESDLPGTSWPVTIAADLLGTPIVNPFIAGGAALALVAGLGTVVLVRRRKAVVEA
jgi:hypothetical protein